MALSKEQLEALKANLQDQEWRLNNLYFVTNEKGHKVAFKLNPAQKKLLHEAWYRNVILKARQLGFTTFIQIFMLDSAIFTPNLRCGVIAHTKEDAQVFFRDKIKFGYDNLPDWLFDPELEATGFRIPRPTKNDAGELLLDNNSSVRVGTSLRSGTLQILHVSEYGKICRRFPDKAKEVRTGAFPAVHEGSWIFVESTAEGREGDFFRMSTDAQNELKRIRAGARPPLNPMEFKFHFFPWWEDSRYTLADPRGVLIEPRLVKYFAKLKIEHDIELSAGQMAWYAARESELGPDMKQEFPSTPEEAFEVTIEGAYFSTEMAWLRKNGRIAEVPWEPSLPVNTFWDIGMNDDTVIWFHQQPAGGAHRLIDYYANSGEGFDHYAKVLKERGYHYGTHYLPHDVTIRELGAQGRTRKESLEGLGVRPIHPVKRATNQDVILDQINRVRLFLKNCWIDATTCAEGIKALDSYRREWDEKLGTWKKGPLHNWASHPVDSLRTGVMGYRETVQYTAEDTLPEEVANY